MATSTARVRWRRPRSAEAIASVHASAACYCLSEHVGVLPVVVPELELREIERQVLRGYVVVRADDAALQECPERIEVRGVDFATHVLALRVANGLVPEAQMVEVLV